MASPSPASLFIRSSKIRLPSNFAFAYKLDPFTTDYTQSCGNVLQNRRTAYKFAPFRTDYTQIRKSAP